MQRDTKRRDPRRDMTPKVEEFKDQLLELRRVTRVTKGGKRMRFRATVIIGDGKGRVGVGVAKGVDVVESIAKAKNQAKKNIITVLMKPEKTITHRVEAKYGAANIVIKPAVSGHGLMAGGAARLVLSLAGIGNITAKFVSRTTNKLANAMVTIEALKKLTPVKMKKVEAAANLTRTEK